MARSLTNLETVNAGFPRNDLLLIRVLDRPGAYRTMQRVSYYRELVERLGAVPGVESVALARLFPLIVDESPITQLASPLGEGPSVQAVVETVSPEFFSTVKIPIRVGRDLSWRDDSASASVAVVMNPSSAHCFRMATQSDIKSRSAHHCIARVFRSLELQEMQVSETFDLFIFLLFTDHGRRSQTAGDFRG